MTVRSLVGLLVLVASLASSPVFAKKTAAQRCEGGRFISRQLLVPDLGPLDGSLITVTPTTKRAATIAAPSCAPVTGKFAAKGARTTLSMQASACTAFSGKVRIVGTLKSPACDRLTGRLVQSKGKRRRQPLAATRSRCGDLVTDPAQLEQCDGGTGCDKTCRLDSGNSGAFGVVTVNGVQKMYLPLSETNQSGHGVVAVVDVGLAGNGVAGAPALITDVDLGTADVASATGGNASVVIVTSISSRTVWFIDPTTDTLVGSLELPATDGVSDFSGGGGVVTGVAVDSAGNRAILSVWNGFAVVDLATRTVVSRIVAPPVENFGFDGKAQRILAPYYDCAASQDAAGFPPTFCADYRTPSGAVIDEGFNVVDLTDGTVYTYRDGESTAPVGPEPDHAAGDPDLGLAVIAGEQGDISVLDLAKAIYDKTTRSFTTTKATTRPTSVDRLTGVAIEPASHYVFLEQEFRGGVGVLKLDAFMAGTASLVEGVMPDTPDGVGWANIGDPHGIAVTTGIQNGAPVGFVVEARRQWIGRIDLGAFEAGGSTSLGGALTFLDARTPR